MHPEPTEISTDEFALGDDMATLAVVADHLIPAAHGMPSAAEVATAAQVRFVLRARPDLFEPLVAALRPELGDDPARRLAVLAAREPVAEAALQMVIVAAYYTDARVRSLIGYPGQVAKPVNALDYPAYLEEGLLDRVVARGPIWRDPTTGLRASGP
jgi:hypothetical protein